MQRVTSQMMYVPPSKSSPPLLSGNAEDGPHHLQKLTHRSVNPERNSPLTGIYRNNSEDTPDHSVLLPHPGLLKRQNRLENADLVKQSIREGEITREDVRECGHERSREEVIKEIAVSSTVFIGPTCRPDSAIDRELSDFYKELEEIEHKDDADGEVEVTESLSQSCEPATNPSHRKEAWETGHKNAYRPYPTTRPQRDYESSRTRRPQLHHEKTWNSSDANNHAVHWQRPPNPWLPCEPPRFPFRGPNHFSAPMEPPYFQPQVDDYRHADETRWSSWEGDRFPLRYDNSLSASETFEGHEMNSFETQLKTRHYHEQDQYQQNDDEPLVLILMRGLPGCGKSTLAKEILFSGPSGLILCTDDYFFQEDGYFFDPSLLGDAHEWNHKRARDAMLDRRSPVIIDNTNIQAWEMKPYVALALECGYRVEFVEPNTRWKCDPAELEQRNMHGVPRETIAKMLDRFELPISVDIVMNSCEPRHKRKERFSKPDRPRRFDDV